MYAEGLRAFHPSAEMGGADADDLIRFWRLQRPNAYSGRLTRAVADIKSYGR